MKKFKTIIKEYSGYYRVEFPAINIKKGEGFTIAYNFKTLEAWVRKNGKLLTFLIDLKARVREFLRRFP